MLELKCMDFEADTLTARDNESSLAKSVYIGCHEDMSSYNMTDDHAGVALREEDALKLADYIITFFGKEEEYGRTKPLSSEVQGELQAVV